MMNMAENHGRMLVELELIRDLETDISLEAAFRIAEDRMRELYEDNNE